MRRARPRTTVADNNTPGTQVYRFDDALVFTSVAYSGLWNRSAGTDSWLNFGPRMRRGTSERVPDSSGQGMIG
jgi:hypothetical protein